jgi:hypothetical protein
MVGFCWLFDQALTHRFRRVSYVSQQASCALLLKLDFLQVHLGSEQERDGGLDDGHGSGT